MNAFYGAITLSAALGISKYMGMDITWLWAASPALVYATFAFLSTVIFQAAFHGAYSALQELAVSEISPEEAAELIKSGQDDENSTDL